MAAQPNNVETPRITETVRECMDSDRVCFDPSLQAWLVRDVASAHIVLGRHDLFSTAGYQVLNPDLADIRRFLMAPPDRHRLLRRVMTRAFTARRVSEIDVAVLRPAAESLVAQLLETGRVDLQTHYVAPYTARAMYGVIGLSQRRGDELAATFRVTHGFWREQQDRQRGIAALALLRERAAAACRAPDGADLPMSLLGMAARERWLDHGLEVDDLVCLIMPLIEAVALKAHRDLTATLLRRVAAMPGPDQVRLLRTGAFTEAAEEAVRLQRGGFLPRVASVRTQLGEAMIQAGDRVYVILGDIGIDPTAFAEPDQFAPWRADRDRAVSFGVGIHRCVGENIAKQIAARAGQSLLSQRRLTLVGEQPLTFEVELEPWP